MSLGFEGSLASRMDVPYPIISDQLTPGSPELQSDANTLRREEFVQGLRVRETCLRRGVKEGLLGPGQLKPQERGTADNCSPAGPVSRGLAGRPGLL